MSENYAPGMTPEYREFQDQAAAQVTEAARVNQERQAQARAFMEAGDPGDVTAGQAGRGSP